MPARAVQQEASEADTIRILISTDNHVGYNERDSIRGDDSWKSFHEVMCLAKDHDVDMILLAGDLFHDNNPSRKAMYQVMRSLRMACLGDKPCELEMLSDASENFHGAFNHVNYEDPDINVGIPVFSIHGNHDDPSGHGHMSALDLLQVAGLVNYYGRTPEADNITIKPVLLQKGRTKLALYGMSNVRDERLFRTFRDGKVKFFQPSTQKNEWFNLMSVHQNHHAYTDTGYLPESFLPDFLDLVIWGHEHECLIDPNYNPEQNFHVMQPGSSVATSLVPGEAVTKQVTILSVTGKQFQSEPIRLKSVRPFVMKEVILADERAMKNVWKKDDNRQEITRYLSTIVETLIDQANSEWLAAQDEDYDEEDQPQPLPLIRLRVEYTAPEGGRFDVENPQRFSNRFVGKVANVNDVVQFHRKKATARRNKDGVELPEASVLSALSLDSVKVEKLVKEFLTAQSLTILPQNSFGDAVSQFVDKDDKHAMETFVNESLANQLKHLLTSAENVEEDDLTEAMDVYRAKLEELFSKGHLKKRSRIRYRPKPTGWDSDMDGEWEDQPAAIMRSEDEQEEDDDDLASAPPRQSTSARGRGRGRGRGGMAASSRSTAAAKKAPAKKVPAKSSRSTRRPAIEEKEDDEDEDVVMLDDDEEDEESEEEGLFVRRSKTAPENPTRKSTARKPAPAAARGAKKTATTTRQSTLSFSQRGASQKPAPANTRGRKAIEVSDDEISDDSDDFDPPMARTRARR
ncbi:DNA repair exonuclease [Eremomyces bilateralis CBS 781.70]|uniref:Double-strand break repair protein n=1 Tax=Eremomyces bilateralis CBS 781.70 TaxID=1392243 RepID=A0A6G1GGT6_9PEZI|nr:DNA repair exonuclease [Eremomyces bilateralis CBS 781.70]KAF1817224.1 DNA repair exonuclease [Eremomyces bilateralis CBS 781.70]